MSAEDHEMLSLFIQEAGEHLETLEADLLQLENNPRDAQRLNRIFRAAHSIKGSSSNLGASQLRTAAEWLEHGSKKESLANLQPGIPALEAAFAAAKAELERLI